MTASSERNTNRMDGRHRKQEIYDIRVWEIVAGFKIEMLILFAACDLN